ncbi:beta/gamma crystallin domain-containing protein [Streptomyces sp. B3I8]|uniref:beta/gamma crystallin domain-containing protein n=1 Tax=Streptomyces sp. B3I8 TaxID=3042303 RepID=UPI0027860865|nr:beta/gamma crystallin domain-containing protein [Streptomyces sp. B3I8]MDQ0789926.1 hypothetical protein [Streptomyces sp. B3I8]
MLSRKLRLALPVAAAAVLAAVVPTGSAHAISGVPCGPSDYLQVWDHHIDPIFHAPVVGQWCFANKGRADFGSGIWVDKISTGNNAVRYYDVNGTVVSYPKNFIITFPNNPPHVGAIEIL